MPEIADPNERFRDRFIAAMRTEEAKLLELLRRRLAEGPDDRRGEG
jgi:hypothetical protein